MMSRHFCGVLQPGLLPQRPTPSQQGPASRPMLGRSHDHAPPAATAMTGWRGKGQLRRGASVLPPVPVGGVVGQACPGVHDLALPGQDDGEVPAAHHIPAHVQGGPGDRGGGVC